MIAIGNFRLITNRCYFSIGFDQTFIVITSRCFYFRVCGYGLWFGSHRKNPPHFSERYGYQKAFHPFGKICIRLLEPGI